MVAAAATPLIVLLSSWVFIAWAGGPEELSRVMGAAGPFATLVILSGLVELAFLTVMVCHIGTGRLVPLAVMLGMATLPWTVGLLGTEVIVSRAMAGLGELEASDARNALALGMAEGAAARMVGAWTSAALLLGLGLGLGLVRSSIEDWALSFHRGYSVSLVFGGVVAIALAATALSGALEAHRLFESLTRLAQAPLPERAALLDGAAAEVARLRPARLACMALLSSLGLALLAWKLRRGERQVRGWMGSAFLVAAVTALLVLDGNALCSANERARAAGLGYPSLPASFVALHTPRAFTPRPLAALATPEGLTPEEGLHLPWSTPAKALGGALAPSLHSAAGEAASSAGITPEPVLPLLADARLSGPALRRLMEAGTHAGAHSVELVGQHPDSASPAALERLEARFPLFALLAARPGALRVLLPSALPGPVTVSWRARFAGKAMLYLAPVGGGSPLALSLHAPPAEVPAVLAGTFVGLELSAEVSLREFGAAAKVLGLAGASPVVLLDTSSPMAAPTVGGTDVLESAPAPSLPTPEFLLRMLQAQRHALKVLRQPAPWRRARAGHDTWPAEVAQRSQTSSTMAAMTPMPSTTSTTLPSNLDDAGTFGAASGTGFVRSCAVTAPGGSTPRLPAGRVTREASWSSSPSRASASTRFMWRM